MEYKLCKDNGNMIRCDFDCRKCANLVYDTMTYENKLLKKEFDKWDKERKEFIDKCQELEEQLECANKDIEILNSKNWDDGLQIVSKNQTIIKLTDKCQELEKKNAWLDEERDRIHDELKELKRKKMVPLSDVYRIIAGHSNYHGGNILSALTCIAEGKDVGPVATYEPANDALTDENKRLRAELKKIGEMCTKLEKENDSLDQECESLLARFSERIAELEKENHCLDQECDELRMMNDELRTMNSDLLYRNGQLMQKSDPVIFQHAYGELSDKIESLKEDIIRLDKCLSKRPCVKMEREEEE